MVEDFGDDRSPLAKGMDWVGRITTGSWLMVVPAIGGLLLDRWLGTQFLFLILGFILGGAAGIWHLVQLVKQLNAEGERERSAGP